MESSNKEVSTAEDIDLRSVFSAIGSFFYKIGNGIILTVIRFRRVSKKYLLYIIISVLFFSVSSAIYFYFRKPKYETSFVLRCQYLDNNLMGNKIERLNKLCDNANLNLLASSLGVDSTVASEIKSFDYEPFVSEQDKINSEILQEQLRGLKIEPDKIVELVGYATLRNTNTYKITVNVTDPAVYDYIQDPIINFFRSDQFVQQRILNHKENLEGKQKKLLSELTQIDSLKKVLFRYIEKSSGSSSTSTNILLGDPTVSDPLKVFNKDYELYTTLQSVESEMFLKTDFEVVEGFVPYNKPANLTLYQTLSIGIIAGIGIAYFLIILIEFNKYLNRVEKEKLSATD